MKKRIAILIVLTLAVVTVTGCISFATLAGFALDAAQAVESLYPNPQTEADIQAAQQLYALDSSTEPGQCKLEGSLVIVDNDLVTQFAPSGKAQEVASVAVAALDSAEIAANCPSSAAASAVGAAGIANAGSPLDNGIRGTQAYADTIAAVKGGKGTISDVRKVYNSYAAQAGVAGIQ